MMNYVGMDGEDRASDGKSVDPVVRSGPGEGSGPDMTLKEMQDALRDESHPLHGEAVRLNKDLAAKMGPALESLTKQVNAQLGGNLGPLPSKAIIPRAAENVSEAVLESGERSDRQDKMATDQLEVLRAMAANMRQLNQQMDGIDQQLVEGNKSSRNSFIWTIIVGILTLFAAVGSFVAALL